MGTPPLPELVARVCRDAARRDTAGIPDADLVARWAGGRDEAAFELLVWRHGPMVLATCRRLLGPGPDLDDAFQATFLTLVRKGDRVRAGASVGGWLHRVAYRVALKVRARRPPYAPLAADPPGRSAGDDWSDVRAALDQEIDALPERCRLPFVLCHLQGKTNAEAARDLGRPVGTIESRLVAARRRLRARLGRRGITLSAVGAVAVPAPLARAATALTRGVAPPHLVSLCSGGMLPMSLTLKVAAAVLTAAALVAVPGSADPPKGAPKGKPAAPPPAADPMTPGLPKGWWGGPFGMGEYAIGLDSKTAKSGKAAAFIRADKPGNGAVLTQMVTPGELKGKRARLSAQVKTKGTDPGAGLWMRVDTPDGIAGFDNMAGRMIKGDTDWATHQVVLEVHEKATGIAFGIILFGGRGTIWIDDVKLEPVGKDVKLTAEPTDPAGDGRETSDGLPEKPTNLGFEDGQQQDLRVVPIPLTEAETAWLKAAAIPLAGVEAGKGFKDLEPLKKVIGDARIVSLGESTHGTREHFQMKHRLLEFLATEMGFTHFAIEANMTEAFTVNEYVLNGTGTAKEALAGLYFWTWNTEEVLAMIEWMREFNKSGKGQLQFLGFDMQTGTVALANAKAFIAKVDPKYAKEAEELYEKAAPLFPEGRAGYQALSAMKATAKKERADAAWAVVSHLEKNRDRYAKAMKPEEVDRGILDATVAAQAARNAAATHNYRDECMAANVGWILDHAPKGSKVVLWAHNGHVGRTEGTLGEHLAKKYGKEMVIVGFGTGEGKYTAVRPGVGLTGENDLKAPPAGSLERAFREAGLKDFVLDLRPSATEPAAKWLARPHQFRSIGALATDHQFQPRMVPAEFDVLVYIDKTAASRCFGFTRGNRGKD